MLGHDNLEEFADPVNYDRADPGDAGVAFYSALAREANGSVLELACGTGRVTIPIARLGFAVTGLDIVPGMLARADGGREHTQVARTALRYTFPQELAALLHYNGFAILRQYGDWDEEPLAAASPSIISVCRKRT